jgi:Fe-S cluster assembly protein SufD
VTDTILKKKVNVAETKLLPAHIEFKTGKAELLMVEKFQNSDIIIGKDTHVTVVAFLTEGWEQLAKIKLHFEGQGAELLFLVFIIGKGKNSFIFETDSLHTVPNTKAKYLVKCAMFDQSFADYKGNLIIAKSAPETEVYLAHHTLLLSPEAHTKTIPALEIEADEVKAGHAATLGKVDEDLMFYLMSRGFSAKEAERMLVDAFFNDQLALIEDEDLREILLQNILKQLPEHY